MRSLHALQPPWGEVERTGPTVSRRGAAACSALLLAAAAWGGERHQAQVALDVAPGAAATLAAVADVWCSDVRLGTALARLAWAPQHSGAAAQVAAPLPAIRVEVTPYALGLERGAFAALAPGGEAMLSMQATDATRTAATPRKLLADAPPLPAAEARFVLLTDLQPGVNYTWRLAARGGKAWTPSRQTMTFQAPICPVDAEKGHEPAARRIREGGAR